MHSVFHPSIHSNHSRFRRVFPAANHLAVVVQLHDHLPGDHPDHLAPDIRRRRQNIEHDHQADIDEQLEYTVDDRLPQIAAIVLSILLDNIANNLPGMVVARTLLEDGNRQWVVLAREGMVLEEQQEERLAVQH